jgi:hypothetical protein
MASGKSITSLALNWNALFIFYGQPECNGTYEQGVKTMRAQSATR